MTSEYSPYANTLSVRSLVLMCAAAGLGALYLLAGTWQVMALMLITFVTDGGLAVLVFIAAGGYGDLIVRPLLGKDCPVGLRMATACGAGLWALGTLMLTVGSLTHGALTVWVWWPILAIGLVAAARRGKAFFEGHRFPRQVQGRSLIWILLTVAIAVWVAGATRPPQFVGVGPDQYDVAEYHLQVPREHYQAGRIVPLGHNVYSHFPMGVEMLYLVSMCLRGGPYEGMYAAKFIHGLFAAAAVLAIVSCFRKDEVRRWASGVLLATTPFVGYLSWLGMVELAEIFYLALALLWLRRWSAERSARSAVCVGMATGGACAVKYLSVGFVVLPVVAMMALLSLAKLRTIWHVAVAAGITAVLFSPWLIRNAATVGNPVFPLAAGALGSGDHWSAGPDERSAELRQRWVDGHAPDKRPPVPAPPGWKMHSQPSRLKRFYDGFLSSSFFGPVPLVLAGLGLCMLAAVKGRADPWEWSLVGVATVQLAVWVWCTHEMPPRFVVPVIVPIVLLVGWTLERVYQLKSGPFSKKVDPSGRPWGVVVAGVLLILAAGTNLIVGVQVGMASRMGLNGIRGADIANSLQADLKLPEGAKPMLIGDAKAFYFPQGTVYATVFDSHPLAEMIDSGMSAEQILAELQARGVTHIYANWSEIIRLGLTYGYPASLAGEVLALLPEGYRLYGGVPLARALKAQPSLAVLEEMKAHGLEEVALDIPGSQAPAAESDQPPQADDAESAPADDAAEGAAEGAADQPPAAPARPQIQFITLYAVPPAGGSAPDGQGAPADEGAAVGLPGGRARIALNSRPGE